MVEMGGSLEERGLVDAGFCNSTKSALSHSSVARERCQFVKNFKMHAMSNNPARDKYFFHRSGLKIVARQEEVRPGDKFECLIEKASAKN